MIYKTLSEVAQAALEVSQGMILPLLGVCLAVAIVFFIVQLTLSFQDLNFQFILRLLLLLVISVYMAKGVSEKFVSFTKSVYESAPLMVR
ncbi:MAG: flagellar biosynthetic protein FliQ [Bdellovibrionota bacterium]